MPLPAKRIKKPADYYKKTFTGYMKRISDMKKTFGASPSMAEHFKAIAKYGKEISDWFDKSIAAHFPREPNVSDVLVSSSYLEKALVAIENEYRSSGNDKAFKEFRQVKGYLQKMINNMRRTFRTVGR